MNTKRVIILNESQMESLPSLNEMEASDVSLSSFKVKDELNEKFWINNKLNSRVRLRLLDIADDFIKEMSVDWVKPKDIVLTGSIANYNWSKFSDIDVHIIYDFKEIYNKKPEFVEDYFNSKKENWKQCHERLTIYGYPVELYVENEGVCDKKNGRYSLNSNEWLVKPVNIEDEDIDETYIKNKVAKYITSIDNIEKKLNKEKSEAKIESLGKQVRRIFKQMQTDRTNGLKSKKGQMSSGNIIYKCVRRFGYIDKIWDLYNKSYDISKRIK